MAASAILPGCIALPCLCALAQGVVNARPSCMALGNHVLETPQRGIKPTWDSMAQEDAAELSNAARLVYSMLKSPPSLPFPPLPLILFLFSSLKKVVFKKHLMWRLVANNLGEGRLQELFSHLRHPKDTPAPAASHHGWVPHTSASGGDKTGCSPLSRIRVLPNKVVHTVQFV